jgi:protein gp37
MTGKTTIEWTDQPGYVGAVWNPTTGCTRVSAGCDNCYAFALHDKRYASNRKASTVFLLGNRDASDLMKATGRDSIATARFVSRGEALPWPKQYDLPFSRVQLLPERLDAPLRTRKPTCYFVDSMADLFHEDVPDEFIWAVWTRMLEVPRHRFLILTKRPERMRAFVTERARQGGETLPNVWLGTSVEDQASADERIPHLISTPAAVRFLSCEPLLGPIHLKGWVGERRWVDAAGMTVDTAPTLIDWVIVGGESGPRARPMDLAWARSLVAQCRAAGVAPFVKQLGADAYEVDHQGDGPHDQHDHETYGVPMRESHGRDMAEWPEDLRIREFPR